MKEKIKLVIPKGRIYEKVKKLLVDAGMDISENGRSYRPIISNSEIEIKLLKPRNIPKLVELGQHDIGFTGYDWIYEQNVDVEEILDIGFDPVKIVVAVPKENKIDSKSKIIVASEYKRISEEFLDKEGKDYTFIRTYGATEVFPPEDADMIIDNVSTGSTLKENNLVIYKEIMKSSTRLIANNESMKNPWKKKKIEELKIILKSILIARKKVMIEMNVEGDKLEEVIKILPCMKSPTVNKLYTGGYAVKSVVPREEIAKIISMLKIAGATDILEYDINKVIL
ncbi:ATP phosphoribosyltransferase [Candidatus Woesearchaeota archaeon]|nr:ATP phosphoribosyltransferase [Candidatus Woesearchaeota archaeon]